MKIDQRWFRQTAVETMETFEQFAISLDYTVEYQPSTDTSKYGSDGYLLAIPSNGIPVCMVGHVDTVHAKQCEKIVYKNGLLSSSHGLGADDRAGILGIVTLLEHGYRPTVLLTDGEESGGWGAGRAAFDLPCPNNVNCLIELDRAGANDYCHYQYNGLAMREWIDDFQLGWGEQRGSYTDIVELMPAWNIAGVNLSIGYHYQHTLNEYLDINQWISSVKRVGKMLRNPPKNKLKFHPKKRKTSNKWDRWWDFDYKIQN